jgi:hypothetical protein
MALSLAQVRALVGSDIDLSGGLSTMTAAQAMLIAQLLPSVESIEVTPDDAEDLASPSRGLYVGGAGNIRVHMNGEVRNFMAVPVGTILPVVATRVLSTGTTATNIVALI